MVCHIQICSGVLCVLRCIRETTGVALEKTLAVAAARLKRQWRGCISSTDGVSYCVLSNNFLLL